VTSWDTELSAAVAFLEDQIDDLNGLLRTTPPDDLCTERVVATIGKALEVLINGWRDVYGQLALISYPDKETR
jgi:hypothetical protein